MQEDVLESILRGELMPDGEAGMLNILLHIMHATGESASHTILLIGYGQCAGAILGVALRSGVTVPLKMSDFFWAVLCNDSLSSPSDGGGGHSGDRDHANYRRLCAHTREACARALRHGVNSTLPEVSNEYEIAQYRIKFVCCCVGVPGPIP